MSLDLVQVRGLDLFPCHALDQTGSLDGITDSDQDDMGLETVSMHEQGGEERVERIDTLDLFERDVFSVQARVGFISEGLIEKWSSAD